MVGCQELLQAQSDSQEPGHLQSDLDDIASWLQSSLPTLERMRQSERAVGVEDLRAEAKDLRVSLGQNAAIWRNRSAFVFMFEPCRRSGDAADVCAPPAPAAASQPPHRRSSRAAGQAGRCGAGLEQSLCIPSAVGRPSEGDFIQLPGEKLPKNLINVPDKHILSFPGIDLL